MTFKLRDKIIVSVLGVGLAIYGLNSYVLSSTNNRIETLIEEKEQVESLKSDISPLLEQSKKLKSERTNLKKKVDNIQSLGGGYTTANEEFLLYLGDSATKSDVEVISFNELGTSDDNGIHYAIYDFELKGTAPAINRVLDKMDDMGVKYSVGSLSMRQNEVYDYLQRFYDDLSRFSWYKEPDDEAEKDYASKKKKEEEYTRRDSFTEEVSAIVEEPSQTPTYTPGDKPIEQPIEQPTDTPVTVNPPVAAVLPVIEQPAEVITPEIQITEMPVATETPTQEALPAPETVVVPEGASEALPTSASECYSIRLLADDTENPEMRLAVTVCFVMFNEPTSKTSFFNKLKDDGNGIL